MSYLHKLVRDRIPDIIKESGKDCSYRILSKEEYDHHLCKKLKEELQEFQENPSIEEAADIYEVFLAILQNWELPVADVVVASYLKRKERGGFMDRIFLESVNK